MYGETPASSYFGEWRWGLSPHVRGNRKRTGRGRLIVGSIPACTGKPSGRILRNPRYGVYPRMYGETADVRAESTGQQGLSPHVRGNRVLVAGSERLGRSIPACTGKPRTPPAATRAAKVYPRMYGETPSTAHHCATVGGLSPHVRGNPVYPFPHTRQGRSIPACTGKPRGRRGCGSPRAVYPRMYGETVRTGAGGAAAAGLSPHVRGNP